MTSPTRLRRIIVLLGFTTLQSITLSIAPLYADIPDKFTNLKILPKDMKKDDLVATMKSFSAALGVRCNHCHVRLQNSAQHDFDWASDDKPEKQTARVMMQMAQNINSIEVPKITTKYPDRVQVKCQTCHRGQVRPWLIEDLLSAAYQAGGFDSLATRFGELRDEYYGTGTFDFGERVLPSLAEQLVGRDDPQGMMKFAEFNLRWFPDSGFAHMMLGQVQARLGNKEGAIAELNRAIELNKELKENAQRLIDQLQGK